MTWLAYNGHLLSAGAGPPGGRQDLPHQQIPHRTIRTQPGEIHPGDTLLTDCLILQLHSVSQTTTHQKLHYVGDTRIRFLIRELSEPTEEALKETDVTVLCFSLETLVSLAQVVSHWSSLSGCGPLLVVGTKSDARPSQANTYQQAQAVASQIGALAYIETSAKSNINIDELFRDMTKEMYASKIARNKALKKKSGSCDIL